MANPGSECVYHIKDVGKILDQVQKELAVFKDDAAKHKDPSALMRIIERAQVDLRRKTDVVYRSSVEVKPAMIEPPLAPPRPRRPDLTKAQTAEIIGQLVEERRRHQHPPRERGPTRDNNIPGRVRLGPTCKQGTGHPNVESVPGKLIVNVVVPRRLRRDPFATPPPISSNDARRGLLHLLSTGLIPRHANITEALVGETGGLRQRPAPFHHHSQQFVHGFVSTCQPFVNAVLDLTTPVIGSVADIVKAKHRFVKPHLYDLGPGCPDSMFANDPDPIAPCDLIAPDDYGREQRAREFTELLDTYSLHQFMIRNGTTLASTPEFTSFRRKYCCIWGAIQTVIGQLEEVLRSHRIPLALINGQRLATICERDRGPCTDQELLDCIVNGDEVAALLRQRRPEGRQQAAIRIQTTWRMTKQRRVYRDLRRRHRSARAIAIAYRLFGRRKAMRARVAEQWRQDLQIWRARQELFRKRWSRIRERRRVIVHLTSTWRSPAQRRASMTRSSSHSSDNTGSGRIDRVLSSQLARLFDLADPNVEVVYVSAEPIPDEVQRYYIQLLQLRAVPGIDERLKFIWPESHDILLGSSVPLSTAIYYSPKCLNRIRSLTKGQSAYIVPNLPGQDDLKLAVFLNLPMLSPEPAIAQSLSSSSGSKRIFSEALIDYPVGSHDVFQEGDLNDRLTQLILDNMGVQRWIIKLDDECGARGLAFFEPARLRIYSDLWHEKQTSNKFYDHDVLEFNRRRLNSTLTQRMQFLVRLVHPDLYVQGWKTYLDRLAMVGGSIEACPQFVIGSPSVNIMISPDGLVDILSTHDQIFSRPYVLAGAVFPQSTYDNHQLIEAALSIGRVCSRRGVIGPIGIDFVVNLNEPTKEQTLLAVDLNLRLTTSQISFQYFTFLTPGKFNAKIGVYSVTPPPSSEAKGSSARSNISSSSRHSSIADLSGELQARLSLDRCYAVFYDVIVPALSTIHHHVFFNMCRLEGVSFDLAVKSGTSFMLTDAITSGCLCPMGIGDTQRMAISHLNSALAFLKSKVGVREHQFDRSNLTSHCTVIKTMLGTITK